MCKKNKTLSLQLPIIFDDNLKVSLEVFIVADSNLWIFETGKFTIILGYWVILC